MLVSNDPRPISRTNIVKIYVRYISARILVIRFHISAEYSSENSFLCLLKSCAKRSWTYITLCERIVLHLMSKLCYIWCIDETIVKILLKLLFYVNQSILFSSVLELFIFFLYMEHSKCLTISTKWCKFSKFSSGSELTCR
jgi:hypothetical protein